MFKKLIASIFLSSLWLITLLAPVALAQSFPECTAYGGTCKTVCLSGENDWGTEGCSQGGVGGGRQCCVPKNSLFCGRGKIDTAIGCIPVKNLQDFAGFLLSWGIGIAGGIAILLIIYAGYMIITSAGNPQRVQAGKELLTAAITGLILLLFGAFILRIIGVNILGLPDFG